MKFDLEFTRKVTPVLVGLGTCIVLACTPIAALAHPVQSSSTARVTTSASPRSGPPSHESHEDSEGREGPTTKQDLDQKQKQKQSQTTDDYAGSESSILKGPLVNLG